MRKWRNCGEEGDTLAEGHCRWCGAKLRMEPYPHYGDNQFCGLRCGYRFGVFYADTGKRVTPTVGS